MVELNRLPNITERALLDLIYTVSKAACWYLDDTGVYWDSRLYDLYEMKQGQGIDMDAFQNKVFPKDLELFNEVIRGAIKDPKPFEVNVRIFIENRYQWVRISGIPSGKSGLMGVTQNIDYLFRENADYKQLIKVIETLSDSRTESGKAIVELIKGGK